MKEFDGLYDFVGKALPFMPKEYVVPAVICITAIVALFLCVKYKYTRPTQTLLNASTDGAIRQKAVRGENVQQNIANVKAKKGISQTM